ncbi:hypothetical protein Emed_001319 [Eimeria media]
MRKQLHRKIATGTSRGLHEVENAEPRGVIEEEPKGPTEVSNLMLTEPTEVRQVEFLPPKQLVAPEVGQAYDTRALCHGGGAAGVSTPLSTEPAEVGEVEPPRPSEVVVPEMPEVEPWPPEVSQVFDTRARAAGEGLQAFFQRKLDAAIAWPDRHPFRKVKFFRLGSLREKRSKRWRSEMGQTARPTTDPDKMAALLLEGAPELLEKCRSNEERVRTLNDSNTRNVIFGDTECGHGSNVFYRASCGPIQNWFLKLQFDPASRRAKRHVGGCRGFLLSGAAFALKRNVTEARPVPSWEE